MFGGDLCDYWQAGDREILIRRRGYGGGQLKRPGDALYDGSLRVHQIRVDQL